MPAQISDPFIVTSLPRLSPDADLGQLCTVPQLGSSSASTFDIGVSGSYIGSFVMRPSPRMIWSYALSPQSVVRDIDSHTIEKEDGSSETRLFAASVTERKKNTLKLIACTNPLTEASGEPESVLGGINEEESAPESKVTSRDIKTKKAVVSVKISKTGQRVFTVSEDGEINVYKFDIKAGDSLFSMASKSNSKVVFSKFVDPAALKLQKQNKIESTVLLVENEGKSLRCRIYAISKTDILELSSCKIEGAEGAKFVYDPSGKLLLLDGMKFHIYSLPRGEKVKSVDLGSTFAREPQDAETSIVPASSDRILVSKNSTLALVDLKHEAVLSSLDFYPRSKELNGNAKPPRCITLLQCPHVRGASLDTKDTFALLLLKNSRDNQAVLDYVSVDVGTGRLADVLGLGIERDSRKYVGVPLLVRGDYDPKEVDALLERSQKAGEAVNEKYEQLEALKQQQKYDELEQSLVAFLKMDDEAKSGLQVYNESSDRLVDPAFIKALTLLLFDKEEDQIALSASFVPESALTYLLTHPLFPKELTPGLLGTLESAPQLMRQAIVTCPNIPLADLIKKLSSVDNDDLFKDIITRMVDEFSPQRIAEETVRLVRDQGGVDLDRIIQTILRLNFGYEVLNAFIDSNGLVLSLHYSRNEEQLTTLAATAQTKIDTLKQEADLLGIVEQALVLSESKKSKHADKRIVRDDHGRENMLKLGTNAATQTPIAPIVPAYSIEKLMI